MIPAGMNWSAAGPPPGIVAEPDTASAPVPAVSGSISSAASRPDVDAPVLSPGRTMTMSRRPLLSSFWLLNAGVAPPCRMNVPSCTLRMRISAGLYVIDSVTEDMRVAPTIWIGIVYGPLPTRISFGGLSVIRAGGAGGGCAGVGATPGAGTAGAGAGAGTAGCSTGGGLTTVAGLGVGAGGAGAGTIPGIGELPGGTTGRCVLPVGNTGATGGCVGGCV